MARIILYISLPIVFFILYIIFSAKKSGARASNGVNSKLYRSHFHKTHPDSDIVFRVLDKGGVPLCFLKGNTNEKK